VLLRLGAAGTNTGVTLPHASSAKLPGHASSTATAFDDKRQFLVEHVECIIYDHYRVTVVGSVPIKMQLSNSQEIENAQNCVLFAQRNRQISIAQKAAQEVRGRRTIECV
jgi:hypothetical protein